MNHTVYENVSKMLYNRGYDISSMIPLEHLDNYTRDELTVLVKTREDFKIKQDDIYVFFPDEQKVGVDTVRRYKDIMKENNIKRAIIVIMLKITPFAKTDIITSLNEFYIEIFSENELLINIVDHKLVPKHELLSIEEKKELLDKYSCKETQLPRISIEDPVAKYYGLKKKDVVKITRISETAGYTNYYRIVL